MEDKIPWIKISELKPHPDNPKDHSEEQVIDIAKSIKHLGWGRPIAISKDNYILAGHGAVLACEGVTWTEHGEKTSFKSDKAPYNRMKWNHDDPEAISYMLADNKLAEKSNWNYGKLESNFGAIKLSGFDVTLTGFDEEEQNELMVGLNFGDGKVNLDEGETLPEKKPKMVTCPLCGGEYDINS